MLGCLRPDVMVLHFLLTHNNNAIDAAAQEKAELDVAFRQNMEGKFITAPAGLHTLRPLDDLSAQADEILTHVARLEQRIAIR